MFDIVEHVRSLDQIEQRTPEWYAARINMITASDIAAVIGKNPYQNMRSVLQKKVNTSTDVFTGNFATVHGNKYEDEARLLFGKLYNLETWEVGLFRHTVHKWLGGSPDGIASDGSLIEIKCPVMRKVTHYIPEYYYPQVQICMEILNIEQCYFIQYKPESIYEDALIDIKTIPRSREWFEDALPKLDVFWKDVLYHRENPHIEIIKKRAPRKTREIVDKLPAISLFVFNEEDVVCDEVVGSNTQDIPVS